MVVGLCIGDLVDVMPHHLSGKEWTIGQVGVIFSPTHTEMIDTRYMSRKARAKVKMPPVKKTWWMVNVEHEVAKGGYATVSLPEMYLGPHNCNHECPDVHVL